MAGHDNRKWVSSEGLPNSPCRVTLAEPRRDLAIRKRGANRNGASNLVHATVEGQHAGHVEYDCGKVARCPAKKRCNLVDGPPHVSRRLQLPGVWKPAEHPRACGNVVRFGQLDANDPTLGPGDAASTYGRVEECNAGPHNPSDRITVQPVFPGLPKLLHNWQPWGWAGHACRCPCVAHNSNVDLGRQLWRRGTCAGPPFFRHVRSHADLDAERPGNEVSVDEPACVYRDGRARLRWQDHTLHHRVYEHQHDAAARLAIEHEQGKGSGEKHRPAAL